MTRVLVIAPHPDDETLGCGGTILKHKEKNDELHWVIATAMKAEQGYSAEQIERRQTEIDMVANAYSFNGVHQLGLPTTALDTLPERQIIEAISTVFGDLSPEVVYLPFPGDAHGDHKAVFAAASASSKWFRQVSLRRILAYETLSETDIALSTEGHSFSPNVFVDISDSLERKIEIMKIYRSEMGTFPFPRSAETITALGQLRGSACGYHAAEAFMLLRERL